MDDSDENESSEPDEAKDDDVPTRDVDDLEIDSEMDSEISGHNKKRKGIRGKEDNEVDNPDDGDHDRFMDDMLMKFKGSSL